MTKARDIIEAVYGSPSGGLYKPAPGEHVVAAALRDKVSGDVFLGDYHMQAQEEMTLEFPDWKDREWEDGFWTNLGRFVNRGAAVAMRKAAGRP